MSVGLQRLREDAARLREGAVEKGEDPAVVDAAVELDGRRRALLGESDGLKAERNAISKSVGEAIKGGADPQGSEVSAMVAQPYFASLGSPRTRSPMMDRCTSFVPPAIEMDVACRNRHVSMFDPSSVVPSSMPSGPCSALPNDPIARRWPAMNSFITEVSGPGARPWAMEVRAR